jgi:hypothetical protein
MFNSLTLEIVIDSAPLQFETFFQEDIAFPRIVSKDSMGHVDLSLCLTIICIKHSLSGRGYLVLDIGY